MSDVKQLVVKPIKPEIARAFVQKHHYSGKTVQNSVLHFGVFMNGILGGVMQFGSPIDKRKVIGLVKDTSWNGFLELNRMAFADWLPKNSESRALAVAFRLIKKHYPQIEWVLSFADGTQCGDGTIYRASGFVLTQINPNKTIWAAPDGTKHSDLGLRLSKGSVTKGNHLSKSGGASSMKPFLAMGYKPLPGFQLRYIKFLNESARSRLTVPIIPFSEIAKAGAAMYKGKRRAASSDIGTSGIQSEGGGEAPTAALHPPQSSVPCETDKSPAINPVENKDAKSTT